MARSLSRLFSILSFVLIGAVVAVQSEISTPQRFETVIVREQDVAVDEAGPNGGAGNSTGYSVVSGLFFKTMR